MGNRERQIIEAVYRLGEASVGQVLELIPEPPTYSSIRKMLSLLEENGLLKHRRDGAKYIYRPVQSVESASKNAVSHLLATFFSGSTAQALNAILDVSSNEQTVQDSDRLEQIIEQARIFPRTEESWQRPEMTKRSVCGTSQRENNCMS